MSTSTMMYGYLFVCLIRVGLGLDPNITREVDKHSLLSIIQAEEGLCKSLLTPKARVDSCEIWCPKLSWNPCSDPVMQALIADTVGKHVFDPLKACSKTVMKKLSSDDAHSLHDSRERDVTPRPRSHEPSEEDYEDLLDDSSGEFYDDAGYIEEDSPTDLTTRDLISRSEWYRRKQCDNRQPFCSIMRKEPYTYRAEALKDWIENIIKPFYEQITHTVGVNDITSTKAHKQPIFRQTEKIFGKLLTAPVTTVLAEEVPELTLKLMTIAIHNQLKAHEDLKEAILHFNGVCSLAFLIFTINLLITIVRNVWYVYERFCTPRARAERRRNRAQAHWDEMVEIMPQVNNNQAQIN